MDEPDIGILEPEDPGLDYVAPWNTGNIDLPSLAQEFDGLTHTITMGLFSQEGGAQSRRNRNGMLALLYAATNPSPPDRT